MNRMEGENDDLWELLGRAKRVEASPYFARKVLRAVQEKPHPHWTGRILLRWVMPITAAVALVAGWTVYHAQRERSVAEFNEFFDQAADLQSLVAKEDMSAWVGRN